MATPKKKSEITARPAQAERRTTIQPQAKTTPPTHEEVSQRAFQLWEAGGRVPGQDLEFWLRAESELRTSARQS